MRDSADVAHVRDALATALSDPTLELLYREDADGGWHDGHGRAVAWPPVTARGRAVTVVGGEDEARAVAMIHDIALRDDEELLAGVNNMILSAWRHERLVLDLAWRRPAWRALAVASPKRPTSSARGSNTTSMTAPSSG